MAEHDERVVEAVARGLCVSKGLNPDCLHQSMFDEPTDAYFSDGKPGYFGWRKQEPHARAALRAIPIGSVIVDAQGKPIAWVAPYHYPRSSWVDPDKIWGAGASDPWAELRDACLAERRGEGR